ncbi:MAG: flagellar hook-basal body protein FliE [Rhodomicrobium sp.]|nr:flagellar hook-basal body protein FliE [Rhodomicrobium sp.]
MIDPVSAAATGVTRAQETAPSFLNAAQVAQGVSATPENFSGMISQMIAETAQALHQAEGTSLAAIKGQASIQDVVESVLSAEQSLQAAIAIRDKITAAYLELSRMSI